MAKDGRRPKSTTQNFYDRIADVHNLAMKVNGYRASVAKYLRSMDLGIVYDSAVLDAGSGTGIVTLGFYDSGLKPRTMIDLDLSFKSLRVAREQFEREKDHGVRRTRFVQGNILQIPFADETFDLVLTCGVLEYVSLDDGLREMARVLKPGKNLVLIPVKPSFVGTVLELLYKFKLHPLEEVKGTAAQYFDIVGNYEFPVTEPIGWSKMLYLLEKKRI
ncbi:MAG: class I SAM-dependent methyltransferase [Pyrinomonadaceae bacterium]